MNESGSVISFASRRCFNDSTNVTSLAECTFNRSFQFLYLFLCKRGYALLLSCCEAICVCLLYASVVFVRADYKQVGCSALACFQHLLVCWMEVVPLQCRVIASVCPVTIQYPQLCTLILMLSVMLLRCLIHKERYTLCVNFNPACLLRVVEQLAYVLYWLLLLHLLRLRGFARHTVEY